MKKILYGLIGIMVVVGVIAFAYAIIRPQEPEAEPVAYDDTWYPSELRSSDDGDSDTNVTYDPDILLDQDEVAPDENFTEFEIEEIEETEASDEADTGEDAEPTESESQEEAEPAKSEPQEDSTEATEATEAAPPTKENLPPGSQVIINRKSNIRVGPNSREKILGVLYGGDIGEMVEAGESWSLINCRETQGYVYNTCWDIYTPPAE